MDPRADEKLKRLRATYEPAAHALSAFLLMPLPSWMPPASMGDKPASDAEKLFEEEGATGRITALSLTRGDHWDGNVAEADALDS